MVSNTLSHLVIDKNVEGIVEDVSTDANVSDAMRSDCNNDGSSGKAANVDKNAASGNVNGISLFASLVRPNSANSKVNSVNGISQRKEGSFASLLRPKEVTNKLRFRTLVNKEKVECSDCVLPKAAANLVKSKYENSIVGFFVWKDPSFPVVQNYVSNTWSKFGFEKITRNDNGVYLFKFASKAGLEQVLERGPISFSCALIEISSASTLKNEVIMAIPEEEGDGHIKEVIRVEYEWKPTHCVECKSFGHSYDLCPKRVRDEVPKAPSIAVKPSTMEDNEEEFVEVKRRKKNKGDASRSFGGIRLPKPNSKVHWQPKKSVDSKGGSNTTSPSGTKRKVTKGLRWPEIAPIGRDEYHHPLSNSFDVLNTAEKEDVQNPKVSDHAGTSSSNLHVNKDQEESLWSRFNKGKENAKSKSSELEDESDDDEVYMPHGGGFTDGMEDDLECYDGYGTHVYDLTPQKQAFCDQYDIRRNSHGRK
ncbi:putative reverse transcriptase domain-containing protein [Tanacetum coccineum]|uniref:Reverse transcriptase domain-containing protein n=1 Tax=Tanacetum coccineum TaxID=301880 RepID=A0ABQ5HW90_9ASTR